MALFGHTKQFSQVLEGHWQRLYQVAYAWTHDPSLAQDLVQETMARALKHKDKITDKSALEIWLFKVMANYWRDLLRRGKNIIEVRDAQLVEPEGPDNITERHKLVKQVRQAIARLNQDQRQVITLIALQGFAYEEVAQILQIPIGTVMSRICRARQQLKQFLVEADKDQPGTQRIWRLK